MTETIKYNNFNITIFKSENKQQKAQHNDPSPIQYKIDQNPIIEQSGKLNTNDYGVRNYIVIGQTIKRITQHTNLYQKLKDLKDNVLFQDLEQFDGNEDILQEQKFSRYFDDQNSFANHSKGLCRRCQKPGHFEKWCIEDPDEQASPKIVCHYCLGDHFHLRCTNTLCYQCNKSGHMAKDCKEEISFNRCYQCGRRGHISKQCGKMFEDIIIKNEDQQIQDLIKCIMCYNRGHLNCKIAENKKIFDELYDDRPIYENQKKKKNKYLQYNYVEEESLIQNRQIKPKHKKIEKKIQIQSNNLKTSYKKKQKVSKRLIGK